VASGLDEVRAYRLYQPIGLVEPLGFPGFRYAGLTCGVIAQLTKSSQSLAGYLLLSFAPAADLRRPIHRLVRQYRPTHACHLVGQGHNGFVEPAFSPDPVDPPAQPVILTRGAAHHRAGPMHQQAAQIAVPAPAEPQQGKWLSILAANVGPERGGYLPFVAHTKSPPGVVANGEVLPKVALPERSANGENAATSDIQ